MLKYASAQIMSTALVPRNANTRELRRFAHRHRFKYEVRPGYLYVRSRAISSRCNDNFDEFPAEELEKSWRTFIGKPTFVNHHNEDHRRARGVIIDAALHKDSNRDGSKDYWVEVLHEIDALRFPRLAAEILNGNIARTSMGCDVAYSICSACGNKATTPAEYCRHIPGSKGQRFYRTTASGKKVGELIRETCYGLKFFENSLLVEPPADPTALVLGVDTRGVDKTASKRKIASGDGWNEGESQSWDSIGERHPHIYGDSEIHEGAEGDGDGIGWTANYLAHSTPEDPEAEDHGSWDLTFHSEHVDPRHIDYARHGAGDGRVQHAMEGYRNSPDKVPPLVLVHRHGVYQVADGHHRAEAANLTGSKVRAYVAYSPYPNKPGSDGDKAPYHGAEEHPGQQPQWEKDFQAKHAGRVTLADLMVEAINQEGGELPAFPWDKAPKINLPMTQKGWDDPRRKQLYDARGERDVRGPAPAGPYQSLIDKLPDHTTQELTNPHGMGVADVGREHRSRDAYPGDKREQWARQRWDNVKWPTWTDHNERPSTPAEQLASKRNIRKRWSQTWKRPLACDHDSCPPWAHGGDAMTLSPEAQQQADDHSKAFDMFMNPEQHMGDEGGTSKEAAQQYPNPADHPWFKETGLSHEHILKHWDAATPEEKAQGARWYPDAHLVAKSIAKLDPRIKDDKEAAHKGGGVLSAYSPQQGWWANQHNAARSFQEQRAIGKGEGIMVMASHANAAQKIMDGMPHQEALKGPKTQDFAHLIEHGGNDEHGNPSQRVVVDRHALSVAAGRRLNADDVKGFPSQNRHYYEHAAEQYRRAAAVASDREGRTIPPHEMQATTWLVRQRMNSQEDNSPGQKGRDTVQRNQRKTWQDLSREHTPGLHEPPVNSHVSGANGGLPPGIRFRFEHTNPHAPADHLLTATVPHPHTGEPVDVGSLTWDKRDGTVNMIDTKHEHRRRGIGDAMWLRAHEIANEHGIVAPRHSEVQTTDGSNWARSVDRHPVPTRGQAPLFSRDGYESPAPELIPEPEPERGKYDHLTRLRDHLIHDHGVGSSRISSGGDDYDDLMENAKTHAQKHWDSFTEPNHDHGDLPVGAHLYMKYLRQHGIQPQGSRKLAYGEQKAPADVDTLREDACPVCGDRDTFNGATCQVCGYVAPPKMFQDPDLEKARQMDLRKDIAEFNDQANPMDQNQLGPDGQPIESPQDPAALDENGRPINPDAADPDAQPGSLPGEVQAEVQPGDPAGTQLVGPDGQPLNPDGMAQGLPDELGAPVDPQMLGPDGQPLQQPGQQMMVGPNGEPLGPQELPAKAISQDGKPFTQGPNMPEGPRGPEGPEQPEGPVDPVDQAEMGPDGQMPNPGAGQEVPGTPGDGVPDLQCPNCGFQADATNPVSVDMDTALMPPSGEATPDGVQAGDVCPNCGAAQLISPAEAQGENSIPMTI